MANEFCRIIKNDLVRFWENSNKKVMADPAKSLLYSGAIKITSLFIAILFPFIGGTLFGISIVLIDREIFLEPKNFIDKIIGKNCISIKDFIPSFLNSSHDHSS